MSLYMCFLHIVPLFWLSLSPFWRWLSWPLVICDTNDLDLNRWPWILTINIHVKRVWVYTLVLTQSSTILVMAFMTLGSDVFSIRPTRIWPMKLFLISRDITPTLFLTRSRLRISNSLATVNKEYQRSWSKKKNNRKDGPNICLEPQNLPRVGAHKGSSGKDEQKLCFLTIGKQDLDPLLMLVHQKGLIFFRGDNKIKT